MAGPAGKLSLMNLKGKPTIGPGEMEVSIGCAGVSPRYTDETRDPEGHVYFDNVNPIDWKDRIVRNNPNGAQTETPPARRW